MSNAQPTLRSASRRGKAALPPKLTMVFRLMAAVAVRCASMTWARSGPALISPRVSRLSSALGSFTSTVNRPAKVEGAVRSSFASSCRKARCPVASSPGVVTCTSTFSSSAADVSK